MKQGNKKKITTLSEIDMKIKKLNIKGIGKNKNPDEELYTVLRVLQLDREALGVTYPFFVEISDKPDIRLYTDHSDIGIEVTFALNQTLQKARKIRDKKYPKSVIEPSLYNDNKDWNYKKRTIEQSIEKSNEKLIAHAYVDAELEKDVVSLILKSIDNKIKKFENYNKFPKNYLLIYNNELLVNSEMVVAVIKHSLSRLETMPFDKIILRIQGKNHMLFPI